MLTEKARNRMKEMVSQAKINAAGNTDEQAYAVKTLYDCWADIPVGTMLPAGKIVLHSDGVLYRVKEGQRHEKQATWAPDVSPSLFTPIPKASETGTQDNPITWVEGMESEEGKYYTDEDVLYLCIESSGIGLYGKPKDLARYFSPVVD